MVHKQKLNLGLNIKRLREMIGMKQGVIAAGCDWSQQKMSKLEHSKDIDEKLYFSANNNQSYELPTYR